MRKVSTAALRRELDELKEQARAELCTCGKSKDGNGVVLLESPQTCAEVRDLDLLAQRPRERCPAMHPDGDAEPLVVRFSLLSCKDKACDCHKAPDHDGCPACEPGYYARHRNTNGAFSLYGPATQTDKVSPDYQPDSPRRSAPAYGPPPSLTGRARDHVLELTPTRRDPDPFARIDPSMLPDCAACLHPASWHAEYRLGGTGCAVAAEIGGNGPCTCTAYNGPPPQDRPIWVDPMQLPGCVCGQYFGHCICDASQPSSSPTAKEHQQ